MRKHTTIDYIIVGQGLAGTCVAYHLLKAGARIAMFDANFPSTAWQVSSGIVNPVTGRKLVKTWLIDELIPHAKQFYADFANDSRWQAALQQAAFPLMATKDIVWLLKDAKQFNLFYGKSAEKAYATYVTPPIAGTFGQGFKASFGYARIKGGFRVNTTAFVMAFRKYLQAQGLFIPQAIPYNNITLQNGSVQVGAYTAKQLIFTEGYRLVQNPFFKALPIAPVKGEVIIIDAPGLNTEGSLVKTNQFIAPLHKNLYWVGSNYDRDEINTIPTPAIKTAFTNKLKASLQTPFKVMHHMAAVRPTTPHRRPYVGVHPVHKQLAVLNGLGTKGTSLAPYFAHKLVAHLLYGDSLPQLVDIAAPKWASLLTTNQ